MAMHDIEDLVEDTIRLVLGSKRPSAAKRRLVHALYRFQGWFDTRDTHARLRDELAAIAYRPRENHSRIALLRLVAEVVDEAALRGNRQMVHQWLAALTKAMADLALGDEVPATYGAMLAAGHAARIRAVAIAQEVASVRRRGMALRLEPWTAIKRTLAMDDVSSIEHAYKLRYLTDLTAPVASIDADYAAAIAKIASPDSGVLGRVPELVREITGLACSGVTHEPARRTFAFAHRDAGHSRAHLIITHETQLGVLTAHLGVQHEILCRWQGRAYGATADHAHFRVNLVGSISESARRADGDLDAYGGWPFKQQQSEKLLRRRLTHLCSHLPASSPFLAFHGKPLRTLLESHTLAALESKRRALRDSVGFFLNDIELMFAYACLSWERGREPVALTKRIGARLRSVDEGYVLRQAWSDGLSALKRAAWFPPLAATFPYKPR